MRTVIVGTVEVERRRLDRVARWTRRQISRSVASTPRDRRAPAAAFRGRCVPDRDDDRIRSVFDPTQAPGTSVGGAGRMMLLAAAIDVAAGTLEHPQ